MTYGFFAFQREEKKNDIKNNNAVYILGNDTRGKKGVEKWNKIVAKLKF
jgi:hypothetical protein